MTNYYCPDCHGFHELGMCNFVRMAETEAMTEKASGVCCEHCHQCTEALTDIRDLLVKMVAGVSELLESGVKIPIRYGDEKTP